MADTDPRLNLPKHDGAGPSGDFALPKTSARPESGDAGVGGAGAMQNVSTPTGEVRADAGGAKAANDFTFTAEDKPASGAEALHAVKSTTHTADEAAKLDLPKSGLTY